jgi:hypothetical protein
MGTILLIISGLSFLIGIVLTSIAQSAIHEIEAGLAFLIFVVALAGGGILSKLEQINLKIAPEEKAE